MSTTLTQTPFRIEPCDDSSRWALLMSSRDIADEVVSVFESLRRHPFGYGWQGLAAHVLESELSDLAELVEFDCENDTFCARSIDRDALDRLGHRLAELYCKPAVLARMLERAPRDAWSEMFLPDR